MCYIYHSKITGWAFVSKSRLSAEGGHLGLMGLKDRIESLGGKFSINSELGVGTALKLSIQVVDDG